MNEWVDVTSSFSEEQRNYKGMYLEINEVYDEVVEVSLFSSKTDMYEIYVSYDCLYGVIYVTKQAAYEVREDIKNVLAEEYQVNKKVTDEFIDKFCKDYPIQMPNDLFFDVSSFFG